MSKGYTGSFDQEYYGDDRGRCRAGDACDAEGEIGDNVKRDGRLTECDVANLAREAQDIVEDDDDDVTSGEFAGR